MSHPSKIESLRNAFFSGLILLAPIAVTWMVFSWLVDTVGGSVRPYLFPDSLQSHPLLQFGWNILAMFLVAALVTGLGWLSRYVLGRFFAGLAERFVLSIPGINTIYLTVKQVVDTFGPKKRNLFSKVVLLEYPRRECWTIGFVTNTSHSGPQSLLPQECWTVFVPTTPNPTGGFMLIVPTKDLVVLDMSVADGMKMVISGGTVLPPTADGVQRF